MSTPRKEAGRKGERAPAEARRKKAAPLIAAGTSRKRIAETLGVHPSTVNTWTAEPQVKASVAAIQASTIEAARTMLAAEAERVARALIAKGTRKGSVGDTRAMMGALAIVGLGGSSRVQVDARVTSVPEAQLPIELARALRDVMCEASEELRAAVRVELGDVLAMTAEAAR